jgi:hypothetical protein
MDCFGQYREECAGRCEFAKSCAYVSHTPDPETAGVVRGRVEFERNAWRIPEEAPGETEGDGKATDPLAGLEEVVRYLLGLDVMALAVLERLIRDPDATQTDIARDMGVTRQNVHAAVVRACRKRPELEQVFVLLARKLTLAKTRYAKQ